VTSVEHARTAPTPESDPRDRFLVELRDRLYDGDWGQMLADLTAVLAGRPYVFELFADLPEAARRARVFEDIQRIHRLSSLEADCIDTSVNLQGRRR
jgi:hypothetical protein